MTNRLTETEMDGQKGPRFAGRFDILIIAVILIAAAGTLFWMRRPQPYEGKIATVFVANEEVGRYPLEDAGTEGDLPVPGREHVVLRFDGEGSVHFHESDCLDQLCVIYGPLNLVNESFACLPNEVVVRIDVAGGSEGTDDVEPPDIIIG